MVHNPSKQAHWAYHHQQWRASGLGQRAYCQREGLSFASFNRWRRLLPDVVGDPVTPLTLIPVTVATPSVTPCALDESNHEPASTTGFELTSPTGWRLKLPAGLELDALARLLVRLT